MRLKHDEREREEKKCTHQTDDVKNFNINV